MRSRCFSETTAYSVQPTEPIACEPTGNLLDREAVTCPMQAPRIMSPIFIGATYDLVSSQVRSSRLAGLHSYRLTIPSLPDPD
jgi:hypothetical protein